MAQYETKYDHNFDFFLFQPRHKGMLACATWKQNTLAPDHHHGKYNSA